MRKFLAGVALSALVAAIAPIAEAKEGWYGRADIGWSTDATAEVDGVDYTPPEDYEMVTKQAISGMSSSGKVEFEDDIMGAIGAGYAYANGFRSEIELAHRTNEVSDASESIDATTLMLNGFYDFFPNKDFHPYVGVGVGGADVGGDGVDSDTVFAYQALVGLSWDLTEKLTFDTGYRYLVADELEFDMVSAKYEHEAVTFGLRYYFGAAAPAPVAAEPQPPVVEAPPPAPTPAACPTSNFTVYFEWDRSNLNAAAIEVIDAAAARARQCNTKSAMIVGHTDASGSASYNAGLSEERAAVVADALVARGFSASLIQTAARGESELAVATKDGVREPQNRRTAVTISFK